MLLNVALKETSVDNLKRRLKALGIKKGIPARKAELVAMMCTQINTLGRLKAHWDVLDKLEQQAIQEAIFNTRGYFDKDRFLVKYGELPLHKGKASYSYYSELTDNLKVYFYPTERYGSRVFIPEELQKNLTAFVTALPKDEIVSCNDLPMSKEESHQLAKRGAAAQQELRVLLNLVAQQKIKVSEKTGIPSKSILNKLINELGEFYTVEPCDDAKGAQFVKSYGWIQLLRTANWIGGSNGKLSIKKNAKATLVCAPHEILKNIYDSWLCSSLQDEFNRIDNIKGQTGKGKKYFTSVTERRENCLDALQHCPVDEWVSINDFCRFMAIANFDFVITEQPGYLYLCDPNYGSLGFVDWDILQGRYIRCLFMEYLAVLGIVDIAYQTPVDACTDYQDTWGGDDMDCLSRYDGLMHFRLTSLGAYIIGQSEEYSDPLDNNDTPLTMLSEHRVQFMGEMKLSEVHFMMPFADKIADNMWQLSQEKILVELESGGTVSVLKEFILARESQPFLPEITESLLNNCEANAKAVTCVGPVLLMQCQSSSIAQAIAESAELSRWCERVGKDKLIIPTSKENAFRKAIHYLGFAMPIYAS